MLLLARSDGGLFAWKMLNLLIKDLKTVYQTAMPLNDVCFTTPASVVHWIALYFLQASDCSDSQCMGHDVLVTKRKMGSGSVYLRNVAEGVLLGSSQLI